MQMKIGDKIKTKRENMQMSRALLAKVSGIPEEEIAFYEENRFVPEEEKLSLLAEALGLDKSVLESDETTIDDLKLERPLTFKDANPFMLAHDKKRLKRHLGTGLLFLLVALLFLIFGFYIDNWTGISGLAFLFFALSIVFFLFVILEIFLAFIKRK